MIEWFIGWKKNIKFLTIVWIGNDICCCCVWIGTLRMLLSTIYLVTNHICWWRPLASKYNFVVVVVESLLLDADKHLYYGCCIFSFHEWWHCVKFAKHRGLKLDDFTLFDLYTTRLHEYMDFREDDVVFFIYMCWRWNRTCSYRVPKGIYVFTLKYTCVCLAF